MNTDQTVQENSENVERSEAVDNVRRQLEEMVMFQPVTEQNLGVAEALGLITTELQPIANEIRANQIISDTPMDSYNSPEGDPWQWRTEDARSYSDSTETPAYNDTSAVEDTPLTEEQLTECRQKIAELKEKVQTVTRRTRMSQRRAVIMEEIAASVMDNADRALESTVGRTHDNFIRYLAYLSDHINNIRDHVGTRSNSERERAKEIRSAKIRNRPDQRSWLFCPMGLEYTYHPKRRKKKEIERQQDTALVGTYTNSSDLSTLNLSSLSSTSNVEIRTMTFSFDTQSGEFSRIDEEQNTPAVEPEPISENAPSEPEQTSENETPVEELDMPISTESAPAEPRAESLENMDEPVPCDEPACEGGEERPRRGRREVDPLRKVVDKMNKRIQDIKRSTGMYSESRAYADNGCIEVCSPVHRNWKSIVDWYRWMIAQLGSSVTVTNRKKGSGGAHINSAIPHKHGEKFMYNLLVDLGNRPYINWIFNDPSDNHTANCIWDSKDMQRIHKYVEDKYTSDKEKDPWTNNDKEFLRKLKELIVMFDSRGFAIRVKSELHFEFRCVDAIRSERDLFDTILFFSEYMRDIYTRTVAGEKFESVGGSTDELHRFANNTRREFNQLLRKIGLSPGDYRRFLDRNFETRRKVYGKKNLI